MESKTILATTKRLILRRYKKEDLQDLFEYLSDKKVVEFEPYNLCRSMKRRKISNGVSQRMK